MPNHFLSGPFNMRVKTVRAMPAVAFAAVSPFQEVLFGKNLISFFRKVIVPFFQRYDPFHSRNIL